MIKNIRVCQSCGKTFPGAGDVHYCEDCAAKTKSNVIRERLCVDCGISFLGGPRARRCPACRDVARRNQKRYPAMRPIGSVDRCERCGSEYTVASGRQKFCPGCRRDALLEWQRDHKDGYGKDPNVRMQKQEKRKQQEKICKYCLRKFRPDTPTQYCSEYCKKEQLKMQQCESDIKRGYNRDIGKYEEKREQYRKEVSEESRQE